ncbi:MAG: hypothetical protein ACRCTY_00455, partial [Candidatus Adiutrix sp.]
MAKSITWRNKPFIACFGARPLSFIFFIALSLIMSFSVACSFRDKQTFDSWPSTFESNLNGGGPAWDMAQALHLRGAGLTTMAARGAFNYTNEGRRHYFKFEMAIIKPNHILLTIFDLTARPLFKISSNGQTITAVNYASKQYATGPSTAANFNRFLPLGLTVEELPPLLTGAPPAPQMARTQKMGSRTELTVVPIGASN